MKVAFAYIDPSYESIGPFHVGIASLIACLKQEGHECQFFHLTGDVDRGEFAAFLEGSSPDVVAFSLVTNAFPHLPPLAALAKQHSEALTICGGVHPTLCPDEVLTVEGVDIVGIGEGEGAMLDLCRRLENGEGIRDIANLWVKDGEGIHRNPLRPLVEDLDTFPFPDREVFPFAQSFDLAYMKRAVFTASRGCPYNCAYCCSPTMKQLYGGKRYIRFRSASNLVAEVEAVARDFPQVEYNVFHDDLLPMRKEWFADFTREYRRKVSLPFEMNCHPNLMDAEIAAMAREAGCSLIRFGIESGSEHIRRNVLDRKVSDERIISAFSCCDDVGLKALSYNMIGLPYETRSQILDTIKLNARVMPSELHTSIFYPYPGTKAYEICRREGFLTDKHLDTYLDDSVLEQASVSPRQLRAFKGGFESLVRLYSRCDKMPAPAAMLARKAIDFGALAATDRRTLSGIDRLRRKAAGGDGK